MVQVRKCDLHDIMYECQLLFNHAYSIKLLINVSLFVIMFLPAHVTIQFAPLSLTTQPPRLDVIVNIDPDLDPMISL